MTLTIKMSEGIYNLWSIGIQIATLIATIGALFYAYKNLQNLSRQVDELVKSNQEAVNSNKASALILISTQMDKINVSKNNLDDIKLKLNNANPSPEVDQEKEKYNTRYLEEINILCFYILHTAYTNSDVIRNHFWTEICNLTKPWHTNILKYNYIIEVHKLWITLFLNELSNKENKKAKEEKIKSQIAKFSLDSTDRYKLLDVLERLCHYLLHFKTPITQIESVLIYRAAKYELTTQDLKNKYHDIEKFYNENKTEITKHLKDYI